MTTTAAPAVAPLHLSARWAFACAVLSGLALPLALAPFDLWPLALLSPALLLAALHGQPARRAALLGYVHGLARYGLGISWVYVSIHVHGPAPPWLAGTLVALFVIGMAIFPALLAFCFGTLAPRRPLAAALAFTGVWVLIEWLLTWFLTGFPWLLVGYAHLETSLAGFAPVGGVLLVSGISVLLGCLLWVLVLRFLAGQRSARLAWPAGSVLAIWTAGALLTLPAWTEPAGDPLRVALAQGVISQDMKWQADNREPILEHYLALSDPWWDFDLVVWPEAALTWFAREVPHVLDALDRQASATGTTLVTGIPDYRRDPNAPLGARFENTAIALGTGHGRYVKQRLVPFGEYVPLENQLRGLIRFFDLPMAHARPGPSGQAPLVVGDERLAMAICYEVVYPDLVRKLARDATLLATISNDTWFGDSIGPEQHLQMARMRALELGRWMVRSTNDGVTAVIDDSGREHARLARFEPDVLASSVVPMTGRTPFAVTGSWPAVVLAAFLALSSVFAGASGAILLRLRAASRE